MNSCSIHHHPILQHPHTRPVEPTRHAQETPSIAGFDSLSDQVFVRDGDHDAAAGTAATDPDVVVIYGWGDGLPQHVAKYAQGYRALFPLAKQVVVLSPIPKAMFTSRAQRRGHMTPVVDQLFGGATTSSSAQPPRSLLLHCMSNTGAINLAATLDAYRARFAAALPHALLVMDSTPGGTDLTWARLKQWSRAMAMGLARLLPWPLVATQAVCGLFLLLNLLWLRLRGQEHAGAWSRVAAKQEAFATKGARRLYMYSRDDDLIAYEDVEEHADESRALGYAVDTKEFYGSGHVGHMRQHPDEYWAAIHQSWMRAAAAAGVHTPVADASSESIGEQK
ncbi:hypothetical protein ISF_07213 [Cordyceps fumosorosea ARSEF 2679]|uniref:PaxU n=1 Tax=Cordyceps fumosorosea (strain ARSEF 2679) TaxID=1081104 RepID=A0A167Q4U5_CORFA|nr:hypothetical protein ISF_07213 [Cordyceps fumosorosea ARSEF 2679]OAA57292.1 hypothetical protein ISF_07213 [Cordyceps fumosorosea ARSEF 2679]